MIEQITVGQNLAEFFNMKWVNVLAALQTPTIAFLGLYIAYQQWITNRDNHREKLFDRRMKVVNATTQFLYSLKQKYPSYSDDKDFSQAKIQAKYLFGKDVVQYLDRLKEEGVKFHIEIQNGVVATSWEEYERSRGKWLDDQIDECHEIFGKYMKFRN